jgi:hypothetical protein
MSHSRIAAAKKVYDPTGLRGQRVQPATERKRYDATTNALA